MVSSRIFLGRVDQTHFHRGQAYAVVEPLLQSNAGNLGWDGPIADPKVAFPGDGFAFWNDPPKDLLHHTLWQFKVIERIKRRSVRKSDDLQIVSPTMPVEILDMRGLGSEQDIRCGLTVTGIDLPVAPLMRKVILWVSDRRWIGPVQVVKQTATGLWKIAGTNLATLDCLSFFPEDYQCVSVKGERWLVTPNLPQGTHVSKVNWEDEEGLANSVIRYLKKVDKAALDRIGLTGKVFADYAANLGRAGLTGKLLELETAKVERIEAIVKNLAANTLFIEELTAALIEIDAVSFSMGGIKDKIYAEVVSENRGRIDAELMEQTLVNDELIAAKSKEVAAIERDIFNKRLVLDGINDRIVSKKQELDDRVERFQSALIEKLAEYEGAPEKLFAEIAIIRSALSPIHQQRSGPSPSQTVPSPPKLVEPKQTDVTREPPLVPDTISKPIAPVDEIGDSRELFGLLAQRLIDLEINPMLGMQLHASFLSSAMPVILGDQAYDVLVAYASCVAGSRLHWIPVSGSVYEPQDLFGHFDAQQSKFVRNAAGLWDVFVEARTSDSLHLVVLDGFNRASVDAYLLPLLASLSDAFTGYEGRAVPLKHALGADERDFVNRRIQWPKNVLVAALPIVGESTLSLPSELWRHAVFFDCNDFAFQKSGAFLVHPDDRNSSHHLFEVPTHRWVAWRDAGRLSNLQLLTASLFNDKNAFALKIVGRDLLIRLYASSIGIGMSSKDCIEFVSKSHLIPQFAKLGEQLNELLDYLGMQSDSSVDILIERSSGLFR